MPKFRPLQVELIEEGRFLKELNEQLRKIQTEHVNFVRVHGPDKTKGSTSKINASITLKFEGGDAGEMFSIKAEMSKKTPIRPAAVTAAIAGEEQDEVPALFVRACGSGKDDPRQGILATQDGRLVDPATGEVAEKTAKPAKK